MSGIPKSKRAKSQLEVIHLGYAIRKRITAELKATFAYNKKKVEAYIKSLTKNVQDETEREEMAQKIRDLEEDFASWFIKRERDRVADFCQGITEHLRAANTIYPQHKAEYYERRIELDRALVCCNKLQDELQYIAETLPTDKNKYMNIVLEIQEEFVKIKALRQSDNRFLRALKD